TPVSPRTASTACSACVIVAGSPETNSTRQVVHFALPPQACNWSTFASSSRASTSRLPAGTSNSPTPSPRNFGIASPPVPPDPPPPPPPPPPACVTAPAPPETTPPRRVVPFGFPPQACTWPPSPSPPRPTPTPFPAGTSNSPTPSTRNFGIASPPVPADRG